MADLLRAHIATNQVDLALADMATLEKAGGGGGSLTQLYFSLGKLLEKEMDALKKKGDSAGLNRTQTAYQKFLTALVEQQVGPDLRVAPVGRREHAHARQPPRRPRPSSTRSSRPSRTTPSSSPPPGPATGSCSTRLKLAAASAARGSSTRPSRWSTQLIKENPRSIEA